MRTREEIVEALYRLHRFTSASMASRPTDGQWLSFNDLRHAGTVLGYTKPGEYGDESDPWPTITKSELERLDV